MAGSNSSNERLIALANQAIGSIPRWLSPDRITPELRALKPDEVHVTPDSPAELRINGRRTGSFITLTVELSEDNLLVRGVLTYPNGAPQTLREDEPDEVMLRGWQHLSDERVLMRIEDKFRRIVGDDHLIGRGRHMPIERQRERVAA